VGGRGNFQHRRLAHLLVVEKINGLVRTSAAGLAGATGDGFTSRVLNRMPSTAAPGPA